MRVYTVLNTDNILNYCYLLAAKNQFTVLYHSTFCISITRCRFHKTGMGLRCAITKHFAPSKDIMNTDEIMDQKYPKKGKIRLFHVAL